MRRFASIDIGTNSVLLLVAERDDRGRFRPIVERAEITRLGRGVDANRVLAPEGLNDTLRVLQTFAREARALGAEEIAVSATSAARDASNGQEFLSRAHSEAGLEVEILSGELEAQLSFSAVRADFPDRPLVVIDIGGGSTEFIYGTGEGEITYRHSFDVGAVRLTERFLASDPPSREEQRGLVEHLTATFSRLPPTAPDAQVVGVAGTVTTLYAVAHQIAPYDASRVHGAEMASGALEYLVQRLLAMTVEERRELPGLQPKRADVIAAGGLILAEAVHALGAASFRISDRGLRWGLIEHRFGVRR